MTNNNLETLLNQVKEFGENNVATWFDYEEFKRKFHDAGVYGYERDIADALNLQFLKEVYYEATDPY